MPSLLAAAHSQCWLKTLVARTMHPMVPFPGRALGAWLLALLWSICAHGEPTASLGALELTIAPEVIPARDAYQRGDWQQTLDYIADVKELESESEQLAVRLLQAESLAQLGEYRSAITALGRAQKLAPSALQAAHIEFRLGELALFAGNYRLAAEQLLAFNQHHPDHPSRSLALPYAARAQQAMGDTTAARETFTDAIAAFPEGPLADDCRLRLALLDYEAGSYAVARQRLKKLASDAPATSIAVDSSYWLAMTHLHLADYEDASLAFAQLLKSSPSHRYAPAARYFRAEALRKSGQWQAALTAYTLVTKRPQDAYRPYAQLGALQCRRQLVPEASPVLVADAIALQQQLASSGPRILAEETTRLVAQALLDREEFDKALHVIHDQLETPQTERPEAHYRTLLLAAMAYRGLGQSARASELLGRIRLDRCSVALREAVLLARVRTQVDLADYRTAEQTIRRAQSEVDAPSLQDALRAEEVRLLIAAGELATAKQKFRELQQRQTSQSALSHTARMLAEATYEAGDYLDAKRLYETLLKWNRHPADRAQAMLGLGWVATKQSQHKTAIDHFNQYLREFPQHAQQGEARLMLARSLAALGQRDAAEQVLGWFEETNAAAPLQAEALYQQALLASEASQESDRAIGLAEQLIREHPDYDRADAAYYLLGTLQLTTNREAAEQTLTELCDQHPQSDYVSDALYRLAELQADAKPAAAGRLLTKLVASHPHPRVLPHALYLQSRLASARRDWESSRASLVRLLKEHPESPLASVARFGVAECYYQQQQYERAEKLFTLLTEESYTREPWAGQVRLRKAQLAVRRQEFAEAIRWGASIDTDSTDFTAHDELAYVLGRSWAGQGEFTRARKAYEQVFRDDPQLEREISTIARWMTGESYFHQRQWPRAAEHFAFVVQADNHPRWQALALLQLGKCYSEQGEWEQAQRCWGDLISQFPQSRAAQQAAKLQRSAQQVLTKETAQ